MNCFKGSLKNEAKTFPQMVTVRASLVFKKEIQEYAEKILQDNIGNHRQAERILWPPY